MKMDMLRFIGAQTVDFPLMGADPSGPFVFKSAEGLGPPEIVVRMGRTVLEKAIYQGKSAALRQMVVLVGLQPNWDEGQTAEELRTQLYSLLTPKYGALVQAQVRYGGALQAFAQGHISSLVPALFTKDPAVQITLDCDYPYLLAPNELDLEPVRRTVGGVRVFDVTNAGTAPSGFRAGFVLGADVDDSLVLSDSGAGGQKIQIDGIDWKAGDTFIVDTRPGTRGVWRRNQGAAQLSVLSNLNFPVSQWFGLYSGLNTIKLNVTDFEWDTTIKFIYQPAYWGV